MMENFDCTLIAVNEILDWNELKNIIGQLSNGVEFMHKINIVHLALLEENIAVFKRDNKTIYKITNFTFAEELTPADVDDNNSKKGTDISDLGILFDYLMTMKLQNNALSNRYFFFIKFLCSSLCNRMMKRTILMDAVKDHMILWNDERTVLFIIKLANKMEDFGKTELIDLFYASSEKISRNKKNWTKAINPDIKDELEKFLNNNVPLDQIPPNKRIFLENNMVRLIKTVRNIAVHRRTNLQLLHLGNTEGSLLKYWGGLIPELLIEIHSCDEIINQKQARRTMR